MNGRHAGKAITVNDTKIDDEYITYLKFGDHATNMPSTVRHKDNIIKYKYDNMCNISEIRENGILTARYTYDSIGRLVREDNKHRFTTTLYTYDNNGNILFKKNHAFTLNDADYLEEMEYTVDSYSYDGDKLMSYNGESFEYDVIGNPTTYRGKTATWTQGRKLVGYRGNTFTYDARGRRIAKNGITFTYDSNGNLIKQSNGLEFLYDHTGVCAVVFNGSTYFYRKNAQGDIISLLDNAGEVSVYYRYNAWGVCTVLDANGVQIDDASHIGNLNPFRYRSYYYDVETQLFYCNSRYYSPELCRWISPDSIEYLDPQSINGLNLYCYCANNPILFADPSGHAFILALLISMGIAALFGGAAAGVSAYQSGERGWDLVAYIAAGAIFGAAVGAAIALGGAAGLAATGASVAGFGLSTGAALGISVGATAVAGMAKYSLECVASNENDWNFGGFVLSGVEGALQGAATFGLAFVGGKSGLFNKLGNFRTADAFYINHGGMNTLRAVFWGSKVLIGETLSKALFVSGSAALARWLIDLMIPDLY